MVKVYVAETGMFQFGWGEFLGVASSLERAKAMIERHHTPGLVWHVDEYGWFTEDGKNTITAYELDSGDE